MDGRRGGVARLYARKLSATGERSSIGLEKRSALRSAPPPPGRRPFCSENLHKHPPPPRHHASHDRNNTRTINPPPVVGVAAALAPPRPSCAGRPADGKCGAAILGHTAWPPGGSCTSDPCLLCGTEDPSVPGIQRTRNLTEEKIFAITDNIITLQPGRYVYVYINNP